jgi:hypothetical protein
MASISIARIVSGGQTGADRGGLDAAIAFGVPHGGWCPKGRRAEDGVIPEMYDLTETESPDYAVRTERNVVDSDGTLIVSRGPLSGGSALTARFAHRRGKPCLHIDLTRWSRQKNGMNPIAHKIVQWLERHQIAVLNIAGPRASHCPGIRRDVKDLLLCVLASESLVYHYDM